MYDKAIQLNPKDLDYYSDKGLNYYYDLGMIL